MAAYLAAAMALRRARSAFHNHLSECAHRGLDSLTSRRPVHPAGCKKTAASLFTVSRRLSVLARFYKICVIGACWSTLRRAGLAADSGHHARDSRIYAASPW